jgi:cysteine-rich repeat protein
VNNPCVVVCGDGYIVPNLETCDDGNNINGDGCDSTCQIEMGYTCPNVGLSCDSICGDGLIVGI